VPAGTLPDSPKLLVLPGRWGRAWRAGLLSPYEIAKATPNSPATPGKPMQTVLLVAHLIIALGLIGVVLLQRSEGGALGIGGGGGGGNLFSARGVGNALTRTTAYLAVAFFLTSIALTVLATHRGTGSVIDQVAPPSGTSGQAPAAGGDAGGTPLPKLDQTAPAAPAAPAQPAVPVNQ
jgi:preprotein translocase subunit SecG